MSEIQPSYKVLRQRLAGHTLPLRPTVEIALTKHGSPVQISLACPCGYSSTDPAQGREHVVTVLRAAFWVNYLGLDMAEMCKP